MWLFVTFAAYRNIYVQVETKRHPYRAVDLLPDIRFPEREKGRDPCTPKVLQPVKSFLSFSFSVCSKLKTIVSSEKLAILCHGSTLLGSKPFILIRQQTHNNIKY